MSTAHKGSRLILKNQLVPAKFNTAHFNFQEDAIGVQYGELIRPQGTPMYTLRKGEGLFGNAVAIDVATTNLVLISDTRWSLSKSNYQGTNTIKTYDRFSTASRFDFKPRTDPATSGWQVAQYSHNIATWDTTKTYTWSIYIRKLTADNISIRLLNGDGTAPQGGIITHQGEIGEWVRLTHTWTPTATTGGAMFYATAGENASFELADPQVEMLAFPTSFVSGTRATGDLTYTKEITPLDSFTVNVWVYLHSLGGLDANWQPIFELNSANASNNRLLMLIRHPSGYKNIYTYVGGASAEMAFATSPNSIVAGSWQMATLSYDGATYKMYLNGKQDGSMAYGIATPSPTATLKIGGGYHGRLNGLLSDFAIFKGALSDEEIQAIYESFAPLYNPYDYRAYAY